MGYGGAVDPADIAFVGFVLVDLLSGWAQLREGIDHDTTDNIPKQQPKEHKVYQIIQKPQRLEILHATTHRARHIQIHYTLQHAVTLNGRTIDQTRHIRIIPQHTEHIHEDNPEQADWDELDGAVCDGFEHVVEGLDAGEDEGLV